MKKLLFLIMLCVSMHSYSQDAYNLWLQYHPIQNETLSKEYTAILNTVELRSTTPTSAVIKNELNIAVPAMLSINPNFATSSPSLLISKVADLSEAESEQLSGTQEIGSEGFYIKPIQVNKKKFLLITATTDKGLLYGTYYLLNQMQQNNSLKSIDVLENPQLQKRLLNHWDNLDRTVERGYAGFSIWDWHLLPEVIKKEYIDYARANASIGINGTVLNNVNASAEILEPFYLEKVKALADAFRPYGIQVYLTARFSAPIEIGGLETADPLNKEVRNWWNQKVSEIYTQIPDFGGFLVKANSEGQPGPNNYGRSHVDGANMLAEALQPHNGIVMWRAFVYSDEKPDDRAKQAYTEFVPFDGTFKDNVLVQVKNGAIDFQPREPFHPLFGAMPNSSLMIEFQITQEYLGGISHLTFLPKLFEETLQEDTFSQGAGSTVAKVIDGSLSSKKLTGIAGVSNIGTAHNWTGHPFAQANWYGYGRLAWNPNLKAENIAKEWLKMTFTSNPKFVEPMTRILLNSREAAVDYRTPLGLHHIMAAGHHQGPGPWVDYLGRADWNSVYYHKADKNGIGFDRTKTGSNALEQYAQELQERYNDPKTTPENYLLWFHHLPWDYTMNNGNTLWYNLAQHYQNGVEAVENMSTTWQQMKPYVGTDIFTETEMLLKLQLKEAQWWRDACLLYFQEFSQLEMPAFIPKAPHTLEYYKNFRNRYAPGINPSWD
ncbi:alpha-glucuronidase family glycosyl hydrolase [Leeuwenhoekiella sp. MAR_2009_132]|uniref:alpha-glucuronidase family glycosyl hydrolase n=1 Tax=Leeuwenhoekiella sp. MAR_2009_132 TaxID=1392489 RepID=UPI000491CC5D|nr:alpha-glucuronidase family glycosyl hydrolase [Leeuwenhoekiella sp. MAR_2009_132]